MLIFNKFGIDASDLAAEKDFIALKAEVNKLDINKMTNVPSSLNNLKTKADDLDIRNMKTVPVNLKKISDVEDSGVVKNTKFNTPEVKNKMPGNGCWVTTNVSNRKISEVENKIPDSTKYITIQEFNKLTAEIFAARLKQVDLENKTNFDNKLASFNRWITSNKTKHLEVQEKLNSLIAKDYYFFQVEFVLQVMMDLKTNLFINQYLDTLELNKGEGTDYVLSLKSKGVFNFKLKLLYTAFSNSINFYEYRIGIKFDKDPLAVEQSNYLRKILNV